MTRIKKSPTLMMQTISISSFLFILHHILTIFGGKSCVTQSILSVLKTIFGCRFCIIFILFSSVNFAPPKQKQEYICTILLEASRYWGWVLTSQDQKDFHHDNDHDALALSQIQISMAVHMNNFYGSQFKFPNPHWSRDAASKGEREQSIFCGNHSHTVLVDRPT